MWQWCNLSVMARWVRLVRWRRRVWCVQSPVGLVGLVGPLGPAGPAGLVTSISCRTGKQIRQRGKQRGKGTAQVCPLPCLHHSDELGFENVLSQQAHDTQQAAQFGQEQLCIAKYSMQRRSARLNSDGSITPCTCKAKGLTPYFNKSDNIQQKTTNVGSASDLLTSMMCFSVWWRWPSWLHAARACSAWKIDFQFSSNAPGVPDK